MDINMDMVNIRRALEVATKASICMEREVVLELSIILITTPGLAIGLLVFLRIQNNACIQLSER